MSILLSPLERKRLGRAMYRRNLIAKRHRSLLKSERDDSLDADDVAALALVEKG